jgi:hypothetical protein
MAPAMVAVVPMLLVLRVLAVWPAASVGRLTRPGRDLCPPEGEIVHYPAIRSEPATPPVPLL